MDKDLDEKLIGSREVAELLRVSKQRMQQLRRRSDFPQAAAELAAGPVWRGEDIRQWDAARNKKAGRPREVASPYSTGGGGVTFERRVAVQYLAWLLTGDGSTELGDGRMVQAVQFQQAGNTPVDDLVILAARPDERAPSLQLALGVRRRPRIIPSDPLSHQLILQYVQALLAFPDDGLDHRLALVVAGPQQPASQLSELASFAADQKDADSFFELLGTPKKFSSALTGRLRCLRELVAGALRAMGSADVDDSVVRLRTWELLSCLHVLMPRLEAPDDADWAGVRNRLIPVARGNTLSGAGHLLDRLEALAGEYFPRAATVDLKLLRRATHEHLELGRWRHQRGWEALDHLHRQAIEAVRDNIAAPGPGGPLHLDRAAEAQPLAAAAIESGALVVHGESGVGKSALVVGAISAADDAQEVQVVCLNLRQLPESSLDLHTSLGCPLERLLAELSAPHRLLVVDGADAAAETRGGMFTYLLAAARDSDVAVVAITITDGKAFVQDLMGGHLGRAVTERAVTGLTDGQIQEVVDRFPQLAGLARTDRSRELLRRLVVIDLLIRSGVSSVPLSDLDAMGQIWNGLVRAGGQQHHGGAHNRERVLLQLASGELSGEPALTVLEKLDGVAIDGLRHDGLLREQTGQPWQIVPEFAHDEIRRYALARALLANGDPAAELDAAGAPRWAAPAARLACQALLAAPAAPDRPLPGRFLAVQAAFDSLAATHGDRWGDVPGEALLTLGDPTALLSDAWPQLRQDDGLTGFGRLIRLLHQRHRTDLGIADAVVTEPVIALLLEEATPWTIGKETSRALREWLQALVIAETPIGHLLRIRLRDRLVAACAGGEQYLAEQREAAAAKQAARTPDEVEQDRLHEERSAALFPSIGRRRRERPTRRDLPPELTDDIVVELLALLGPDLGQDGERLLRQVAADAPQHLAPALEEVATPRALASHSPGLLVDLTEAYYLDKDEDGSDFHEDGVRDHKWHGVGMPLAAWYRGPFSVLFRTDLRRGIAVLNRILNHAAMARARTLAGLGDPWSHASDEAISRYKTELSVTGQPRLYVGDGHVWMWYRGTGVGPYPAMSALQALELVCDQLLEAQIPLDRIVALLLDGCENLAMLGMVVGVLVRHLDKAGQMLDPFLAEPIVWELEFRRVVSEHGGLAASSEGVTAPERRQWSLREAASWMAINSDAERAAELRAIGDRLIAAADAGSQQRDHSDSDTASEADPDTGTDGPSHAARVWATALNRDSYNLRTEGGVTYLESSPPPELQAAMQPANEEIERSRETIRLVWRYFIQPRNPSENPLAPSEEELNADLLIARDLFTNPPDRSPTSLWDALAAVSAAALESHVLKGMNLTDEGLRFSVQTILAVAEGAEPPRDFEFAESFFEQGADRSAARAAPLLLLPSSAALVNTVAERDGAQGEMRVHRATELLAQAVANETRLHLARGLDAVWDTPCTSRRCHHKIGLNLAIATMRECVIGPWDSTDQRRPIISLRDPVARSISTVRDQDIYVARLDAAIRALGAASVRQTCVQPEARRLLNLLLQAQRRGLLAYDEDHDDRGSHALVAARALLGLAAIGEDRPLLDHIEAYSDRPDLLGGSLRALAAAAEETQPAAEAARRIWPDVIRLVLALNAAGHHPFNARHSGEMALASLMPNPTYETAFLYRELGDAPLAWTDALGWRSAVETWLPLAAGHPDCVDSLIGLVRTLPLADQVRTGLPWVVSLVRAHVKTVVRRTFYLTSWLKEIREMVFEARALDSWQVLVDAMVVAGDSDLVSYSE